MSSTIHRRRKSVHRLVKILVCFFKCHQNRRRRRRLQLRLHRRRNNFRFSSVLGPFGNHACWFCCNLVDLLIDTNKKNQKWESHVIWESIGTLSLTLTRCWYEIKTKTLLIPGPTPRRRSPPKIGSDEGVDNRFSSSQQKHQKDCWQFGLEFSYVPRTEIDGVTTECNLKTFQELVHSRQ